MYTIEILQYPVVMRLGFFPDERRVVQEVYISVRAQLDSSIQPGLQDNLDLTLDYGRVMRVLDEVLTDKEVKLVETVVEMVGEAILETFASITSVEVSVEKRTLPKLIAKGAHVRVSRKFIKEETPR